MAKVTIEVDEETHIKLLELQLERKKKKLPYSALNQIAAELLKKALGEGK